MPAPSLLQRLKERKLVQWALAYLAGAWALVEATNLVADQFGWPAFVGRAVTVAAFCGLLLTLVLAWYHGEKGRQRVSAPELLILALVLLVGGTGISVLGRGGEIPNLTEAVAGPSDLVRFASTNDDRPTIAVLPLANLSAREENGYFAAGIHEELLRRLSLVRALAVISRTSVLKYAGGAMRIPEIAAELGARYIVEGSVQEDEGRVRIQVQLIDASSDRHVWAERYDRTLESLFELQSEVAQAIARALEAAVSPDERERMEAPPTQDPIAYDLYLQALGMSYFVKEEYDTGIELFRRATLLDPDFALAHASLSAFFWNGLISHGYPPFDSAVARVDVALESDPDLPFALGWKATLLASAGQYEAARAQAQHALALDPSNTRAWTALAQAGWWGGERVGGALAGRRGARVDPNGWGAAWNLGMNLMFAGMYSEARAWFERVLEVDPDNMYAFQSLMVLSMATHDMERGRKDAIRMRDAGRDNRYALYFSALFEIVDGNLVAAEAPLKEVVSSSPDLSSNGTPTAQALLLWVMAQSRPAEVREQLDSLRQRRVQRVESGVQWRDIRGDLALIASVLGDADEQLYWLLEAAQRDRQGVYYVLRDAPFLDRIRSRPEFRSWVNEWEQRTAAQRRELAAMGEWMPDAVLGGGGP